MTKTLNIYKINYARVTYLLVYIRFSIIYSHSQTDLFRSIRTPQYG